MGRREGRGSQVLMRAKASQLRTRTLHTSTRRRKTNTLHCLRMNCCAAAGQPGSSRKVTPSASSGMCVCPMERLGTGSQWRRGRRARRHLGSPERRRPRAQAPRTARALEQHAADGSPGTRVRRFSEAQRSELRPAAAARRERGRAHGILRVAQQGEALRASRGERRRRCKSSLRVGAPAYDVRPCLRACVGPAAATGEPQARCISE